VPWLTYAQIGERFGLGTEAARTRVRRLGWRTQPGNDGRTLAMVPDDVDLRPAGARAGGPAGDHAPDRDETALTGLLTGALATLEGAVEALREQLDATNARAVRAEADRADERRRADDLRAQIDVLNVEMTARRAGLEADLEAARRRAQEAQRDADALRAIDDRRMAMSRWGRAWEAWRGR
jgi:chromosome segregation ATPase